MRLLLLGGTRFVGRQIVLEAVRRGHEVTVVSRGRHVETLPPEVESLVSDRKVGLSILAGRRWDAVIDTSGYRPDDVRRSASQLQGKVDCYALISTLDVYPDHSNPGLDECSGVDASWDRQLTPHTDVGYRLLKAACEEEVRRAFPDRCLIFRSGLIVGPSDPTGRFSYWPLRIHRGGEVLVPAPASAPLQFIDVRDHADFALGQVERLASGTYNTTSPAGACTFGSLMTACKAQAARPSTLVWVNDSLLAAHGVRPWRELPLWRGTDPSRAGTMSVSTERAQAHGLVCRSAEETVRDVLKGAAEARPNAERRERLTPLRERQLILIAREEGFVVDEWN